MQATIANIREPNPMKTESGEEHGLIKVVANSVPNSDGKRFKEKDRESMKKMRDEQSKMVKKQYINMKGPQERLEIPYMLWDGDPVLTYRFIPDHIYDIPQGLVDMVNEKTVPKRSDLIDPNTKKIATMDSKMKTEHRFVSV
jgi:hypothetical protein